MATATKINEQNTTNDKKDPLPKGWLTPTGLAKVLSKLEGVEIRPQRIYGYVKSGKEFPHKKHTDGRVIVDEAKAIAWFKDLKGRKADKEAASDKSPTVN